MIWLSLPLGLLSWLLPIVLRNKKIKPTAVSAASFFLCILALLNVLWELYRRTVSGDHSALLDITPALTACSAALVIGTLLLNLWLHLSKLPLPRRLPRVPPFGAVLLLQTLAFLPAPLLAINGDGDLTGYRMGVFYCAAPLGLAVVLLAVYLHKTPKERVSFGVPLAVAAFLPVQYLLHSIPVLLGVQADVLPYEWDQFMNAFYPIYYLPVLLMTATSVGWLRFLVWRKDHTLPKLTLRRPVLVQVLAVTVLTVLAMALTLRSPDIHLEKGEFLMLESDAPLFFAVAFGVVTLLFGLFLLVVYRKRKQKTGLICFLLQWAFTLAAFCFLMTGLTLRPGDVGGMYTEHVSLNVGLAGLCWAASMIAMGYGLKQILDTKKGEPHESE